MTHNGFGLCAVAILPYQVSISFIPFPKVRKMPLIAFQNSINGVFMLYQYFYSTFS